MRAATEGRRSATLNGTAFNIGRLVAKGVLTGGTAFAALVDAAKHMAAGSHPFTAREVEKVARCGLRAGMRERLRHAI